MLIDGGKKTLDQIGRFSLTQNASLMEFGFFAFPSLEEGPSNQSILAEALDLIFK